MDKQEEIKNKLLDIEITIEEKKTEDNEEDFEEIEDLLQEALGYVENL